MKRIQRKREKGWRMPEGAVYVGRPTRWGSLYRVGDCLQCQYASDHPGPHDVITPAIAVEEFRASQLDYMLRNRPGWIDPLRDATALACWCPLDQPCHADVLIELLDSAE